MLEGYDLFIQSQSIIEEMLSEDVRSFSFRFQIELKIETIALEFAFIDSN